MTIRNMTPHTVNILSEGGSVLGAFPSEGIARAAQANVPAGEICGVPIVRTTFGATVDLPAPQEGVMLIVSVITANAAKAEGRDCSDLLLTCDPVRNDKGQVIGCRSLALYKGEEVHVYLVKKIEENSDSDYYGIPLSPIEVTINAFATLAEAKTFVEDRAQKEMCEAVYALHKWDGLEFVHPEWGAFMWIEEK